MSSRVKKQLIIGIFTLLVFAGALFGSAFYVWTKMSPRSDDTEPTNGNTNGAIEFEDLEVVFTDFFEVRKTQTFDAVALIENPNSDYGASKILYEFVFENASGETIGTVSGLGSGTGRSILDRAYILPGQTRYIIKPALSFKDRPARVIFRVKEVEWEAIEDFSLSGLAFKDAQFSADPNTNSMKFSGVVQNRSPYNLQNLEVHVVLYDPSDNSAIAAGRTDMQTLLRNQDRFFQVVWPYTLGFEPRVDLRIETNLFENSNFIRDQQGRRRFQEFFEIEVKSR